MTMAALTLVLGSAILHALWNLAAKRARSSGVAFVWTCAALSTLLWAPLALWLEGAALPALPASIWVLAASSALLHIAYFITLRRAYALADLSVVYPVARGTGPLFASAFAVLLFAEPFGPLSALGLALIVLGSFTIGGGLQLIAGGARPAVRQGLKWGAVTGLFIAAYTINDGFAVRYLDASPLLFDWLGIALRALVLLPFAVVARQEVAQALRDDWRPILVVATLSPLAYMLALYAMKLAPVSVVAPAREISMLIAAFIGVRLLGEGELVRRLIGASLIAGGVAALALAR